MYISSQQQYNTQKPAIIDDQRTVTATPLFYWVATDSLMSGWGHAPGRSLFAVAVYTTQDDCEVEKAMRSRNEFKRVRAVTCLNADGTPRVRLHPGDHISIRDYTDAVAFYPHRQA